MPASRSATINSEVATGRRMNCRDGFMRFALRARLLAFLSPALAAGPIAARRRPTRAACRARSLRVARDELDLRALAELVGAVDDDERAMVNAAVDRTRPALHGAD